MINNKNTTNTIENQFVSTATKWISNKGSIAIAFATGTIKSRSPSLIYHILIFIFYLGYCR